MNRAAQPLPRREALLLAGLLLIAAALRLADIPFHHYAPDEGFSVALAKDPWPELIRRTAQDTHPPFYYGVLKAWFLVAPATLNSAKALSAGFMTAALAVMFLLARCLFGSPAAWIALVCAALSPYQIYWSHVARMHQLQPLFVVLVIHLSYRFSAEGGLRLWTWLALAWVGCVQTGYMGLVFGVVWALAFVCETYASPRRMAALLSTGLVGALSLAYWFPVLRVQMAGGPMNHDFFQETVSPIYLYYHSLFGTMEPYQPNQSGWQYLLFLVFAVVFVFGVLAVRRRASVLLLVFLTPTLPIVIAKACDWTLAERHLLFAIPFFMAYWGAGCVEVWKWGRGKVRLKAEG